MPTYIPTLLFLIYRSFYMALLWMLQYFTWFGLYPYPHSMSIIDDLTVSAYHIVWCEAHFQQPGFIACFPRVKVYRWLVLAIGLRKQQPPLRTWKNNHSVFVSSSLTLATGQLHTAIKKMWSLKYKKVMCYTSPKSCDCARLDVFHEETNWGLLLWGFCVMRGGPAGLMLTKDIKSVLQFSLCHVSFPCAALL